MSHNTQIPSTEEPIQNASDAWTAPEAPDVPDRSRSVISARTALPYRSLALPVLIGLAMLAVAAYAVQRAANEQDPHYARATKMIADYEWGRLDSEKNYDHPVYQAALGELALVDPDSESARDAQQLAQRLESLIAKWRAAQEAAVRARPGPDTRERRRDLVFFENQRTSRMNPVSEYTECEAKEPAGTE